MTKIPALLFCLFFMVFSGLSNAHSEHASRRMMNENDGLDTMVQKVIFDGDGFSWLLTEKGLFRAMNTGIEKVGSRQQEHFYNEFFVNGACLDDKQILVSTLSELFVFDERTNRFTELNHFRAFQGKPINGLAGVVKYGNRSFHLLTQQGRLYFVESLDKPATEIARLVTNDDFKFIGLVQMDEQHLLAYSENQIAVIDTKTFKVTIQSWSGKDAVINQIISDKKQHVWLAANNGLYRLQYDDSKISHKQHLKQAVFSVASDSHDELWLVTEKGMKIWSLTEQHLHDVEQGEQVEKLFADKTNLIWGIGNHRGVAIFNETPDFITDEISRKSEYMLPSQDIWNMYGDNDELWVATANYVVHINRKTHQVEPIMLPELAANETVFFIKPFQGSQLLLSSTDGLFILNPLTKHITRFADWAGTDSSLENKTTYDVVFDPEKSRYWFATSSGLYFWDIDSSQVVKSSILQKLPDQVESVRSLHLAADGKLWFARFKQFGFIQNDKVTKFDSDFFGFKTIPTISEIIQVDNNTLWFGTFNRGVFEYKTNDTRAESLNQRWGTHCEAVYFIRKVEERLFVGCDDKLIASNMLNTQQVTVLEQSDGLLKADFNEGSAFYHPDAGFYVGTTKGVMLLDPDKIKNRLINDGVFLAQITAYYPDREEIRLSPTKTEVFEPDVSLLSLKLATHDYLEANLNHLSYRFNKLGVESKQGFIQLSNHSVINLSSLAPGQYTLELYGDVNGMQNKKPYIYSFTILQNWWQSQQFKTVVSFSIFVLLGIFLMRHQARTRKTKVLNQELLNTQERLHQALKSSDSFLWEWEPKNLQVKLGNYNKIFDKDQNHSIRSVDELNIHPDDKAYVLEHWERMLTGKQDSFELEYRLQHRDGSWRWIRTKGRPTKVDIEDGTINTVSGISTDITSTRNLENKLSMIGESFENTSEGILIFDSEQQVILSNKAAQSIIGVEEKALIHRNFCDLLALEREEYCMDALLEDNPYWHGELAFITDGNPSCPVWVNLSAMQSRMQTEAHYVAVFSDITERKRTEAELRQLANYDGLTGLPNRTLFNRELAQAIHEAKQESQQLALMFLDLDRFKDINDTYGHSMGDAVLMEASKRLIDSIGKNTILCRFGGDEFVVLIKQVTDIAQLDHLASIILKQIETPFIINGREFYISTSIGISLFPDHALTAEGLIKNADLSMYHAKDEGRGNHQYYSLSRYQENQYQLQLEHDLRYAFKKHEFELNFQPQISVLDDDQIVGMEALLRWNHTQKGYIRPDIFIPVAEKCGLIVDIDRWVLFASLRQLAKWQGRYQRKFRLSINVSAAHFRQPDYVATVKSAIEQTGVSPSSVGLEITEGVLMNELNIAQSHLSELHAMGVEVAIDDFGTGYSSLAYLRNFKVNTLKIDRKFIIDIAHNRADQAIVNSIVELARNLKLKVVAEGIETYEQLEHLIGRGCYLMQGYYFSRPLDIKGIEQYLEHADELEREI
ncbi:EAL domain-containing protein [Parashewanella curva]|uniref:EAL domain-containing protein n=1 Tax=Parashewanella curva TaxID=2338552 RepID=A0A3L8PZN6_9GAMM|nr:EAL domain-containing protein [Parashewanella curva]RLV59998.1 EAL domain-containing protein [Parashewanella curva]